MQVGVLLLSMNRKGHTFYLPYLQQKYKTPTWYTQNIFIFNGVGQWFWLKETLASLSMFLCMCVRMYVKRKLSETYSTINPFKALLALLDWVYFKFDGISNIPFSVVSQHLS
jgi:hypothetical protein